MPQVAGFRGQLQRLAIGAGRLDAQVQGALAFGQALASSGFERFDLTIIMGRTQVLDLA